MAGYPHLQVAGALTTVSIHHRPVVFEVLLDPRAAVVKFVPGSYLHVPRGRTWYPLCTPRESTTAGMSTIQLLRVELRFNSGPKP